MKTFYELLVGSSLVLLGFAIGATWHEPPPAQPVSFSLEGAGICKATGGGKTWLVVDMTHEFLLPEEVKTLKEGK
mgnify:CR=1 FL=1